MIEPKRILFVINALGPGGAERQLLYLLRNLDRTRFEPHVVTVYDNPDLHYYETDLDALNISHYSLAHGQGIGGRITSLHRYIQLVWRLRPSIVQSCIHYANLIVRIARPFCPPHHLITSKRSVFPGNELRSERLTCWLDDHLVVNSPHSLRQIQTETNRPHNKVSYIPNAIPLEDFTTNNKPDLRQSLFPHATFVIGLVGRIHAVKDHKTFLKALHLWRSGEMTKGLAVFFLGDVNEPKTQAEINTLIESYQLQSTVHQLGLVRDVVPYYHAADITVLPSLYEGFPNVVLEAFAAGKPVIISEDANAVNVVEHGVTGWVFPTGDAQALAECLLAAMQAPPQERQQMGLRAQEVAQQYSISVMTKQYVRLYDQLLANRS